MQLGSRDASTPEEMLDVASVLATNRGVRAPASARSAAARRAADDAERLFRDELVHLDGDALTYVACARRVGDVAEKSAADARAFCQARGLDADALAKARRVRVKLAAWLSNVAKDDDVSLASCGDDPDPPVLHDIALPSGSALLMAGDAQARYEHALPLDVGAAPARISLTYRSIVPGYEEERAHTQAPSPAASSGK